MTQDGLEGGDGAARFDLLHEYGLHGLHRASIVREFVGRLQGEAQLRLDRVLGDDRFVGWRSAFPLHLDGQHELWLLDR